MDGVAVTEEEDDRLLIVTNIQFRFQLGIRDGAMVVVAAEAAN